MAKKRKRDPPTPREATSLNAVVINQLLETLTLEAKNLTVGSNVSVGHLFALYLETKTFSAVESQIKKQLSLKKMKAFRHLIHKAVSACKAAKRACDREDLLMIAVELLQTDVDLTTISDQKRGPSSLPGAPLPQLMYKRNCTRCNKRKASLKNMSSTIEDLEEKARVKKSEYDSLLVKFRASTSEVTETKAALVNLKRSELRVTKQTLSRKELRVHELNKAKDRLQKQLKRIRKPDDLLRENINLKIKSSLQIRSKNKLAIQLKDAEDLQKKCERQTKDLQKKFERQTKEQEEAVDYLQSMIEDQHQASMQAWQSREDKDGDQYEDEDHINQEVAPESKQVYSVTSRILAYEYLATGRCPISKVGPLLATTAKGLGKIICIKYMLN